jgi:ankyrin repeat protein
MTDPKPLRADFNAHSGVPSQDVVKSFFDAAEKGDLDHIRGALELYPALIGARNNTQATPLIVAAKSGNAEVVSELVGAGADIKAVDAGSMSAICHAAYSGHSSICYFLIGCGAHPGERGRTGMSAVSCAMAGDFPSLSDSLKMVAVEMTREAWRNLDPSSGTSRDIKVKRLTLKPNDKGGL